MLPSSTDSSFRRRLVGKGRSSGADDSRGIAGNSQAKVTSDSSRRINTVQEGRDANLCVEYVAPEDYAKVAAEADDTIINYFTEEEER